MKDITMEDLRAAKQRLEGEKFEMNCTIKSNGERVDCHIEVSCKAVEKGRAKVEDILLLGTMTIGEATLKHLSGEVSIRERNGKKKRGFGGFIDRFKK